MKLKSVAGFTCYVTDLDKTAEFYETIGFEIFKKSPAGLTVKLNWFLINFVLEKTEEKEEFHEEAHAYPRGNGIYINMSVEDVDEYYKEIIEKGFKPSSEPRNWPWGSREFVLRDPDGYKLVFFTKK